MSLLVIFLAIVALVLLVSWAKVNPFLAFLIVSIGAGLALGIGPDKVIASVQKGMGDTMGSLIIIICLGAMLGKLIATSGAAQKIADVLVQAGGEKNIQWALVVAGIIVGIPLFYGIGFVLVVPLIFSIAYKYKINAVYIGLPMLSALSVTHGFLPPHPSPTALVKQFHADLGLTFIYGFIIAVPTIILAGPLYARTLKHINPQPLKTFRAPQIPQNQLPGTFISFFSALLPVILLMAGTAYPFLHVQNAMLNRVAAFITDGSTVMLISLITATFTVGISMGKKMADLSAIYVDALKDIAVILLIIAGSGAFKQVLVDSGISTQIAGQIQSLNIPPLIMGWLIAAIIRISLGSSTVAGLTAAAIVAPTVIQYHVNPNLMVLSIGAGSLVLSHVNDSGFWLYKEYFNLSIKDTFRSWSAMETLVAICGLGGVLLLNLVV
ncbi:gluconate:H+ symporter [Mucilaginibacter ginkgonis]|uniref:Gluconate transporter n=1 Tax=Mucilaginibacter ginkgonis TaxID=2682091 RepID=A0A6I4HWI2_9SPHI|nr:gluconate:H+ symporter [Mucilaginibacter ginkgonis]QQL50062.1 gluconate transporter [Mucilaginibacter ginkgonis]